MCCDARGLTSACLLPQKQKTKNIGKGRDADGEREREGEKDSKGWAEEE